MAPNLLFPYAREAVESITTRGGFPAINLQPVNFEALFHQMQQREAAKGSPQPH